MPPTAASSTCARSCPTTPTRSWRFHARLSERTRYLRYFGPYPHISARDLERFTVVDHHDRVAFVVPARRRDHRRRPLRGHARAGRHRGGRPGRGGVRRRATPTRAAGSARSCSSTSPPRPGSAGCAGSRPRCWPRTAQMVRVFRDAGYQVSRAFADGVLHLEFDIDPTERSLEVPRLPRAARRGPQRAQRAAPALGRGDRRLHRPDEDRPRGAAATCCAATSPARSTRSTPRPARCAGCAPTPSVTDIPDDVDLAVVAVPAAGDRRGHGLLPRQGRQGAGRASAPGSPTPGRTACAAERRLVDGGPRARHARGRPERARAWPTPTRRCGSTPRSRRTLPAARPGRVLQPVRRAGHRDPAPTAARARAGPVDVRLGGQPRRPVGQRPAAVLADRPRHRRRAALPGVVRQPAQVRPAGPPARPHQADRRGEERPARTAGRRGSRATGAGRRGRRAGAVRAARASSGSDTSPQLFDTALLLAHQPLPAGGRVAVVGNSTALSLLVVDALLGEGLELAGEPVDAGTTRRAPPTSPRPSARRAGRATSTRSWSCSSRRSRCRAPRTPRRCARRSPGWTSRWSPPSSPPRACPPSSPSRARTACRTAGRCPATRARSAPSPRSGGPCATRAGARATGGRVRAARRDRRAGRAGARRAAPGRGRPGCRRRARRRRARRAAALLRHRDAAVPAGRAARPRPSPPRASWASRWRSRPPASGGGTASTGRACG